MIPKELFLRILKHFLHPDMETGEMELSAAEIPGLMQFAAQHSVCPIVYDAIKDTEAFAGLPEQVREEYHRQVRDSVIIQICKTNSFLVIYRKLAAAGVTALVLKGIVLRSLYAKPDYRASCDEDLLIPKAQFYAADRVLREAGFSAETCSDPLQRHEITYHHAVTGVHLEIHLSLFPEDSQAYGRLNEEFPNVFDRRTAENIDNVRIETLDPTQHMLYLLCHGLKHFLHSGFGIRQICDMLMFAQTFGDRIDWKEVEKRTRRQHMYVFWMNLFDIGEKYLGFSWKAAGLERPENLKLDSGDMLEDLLDSGIYGKSSAGRNHSANMTLQAAGQGKQNGLRTTLFPNFDYMSSRYPYLKKHRWLLPAAWIQRDAEYFRHSNRREISEALSTGNRRISLLEKYEIVDFGKKNVKTGASGTDRD